MESAVRGKKILVATGLYPPEIGGPANYSVMLEKHLPSRGFELTVVPFSSVRHLPKMVRHMVYAWKLIIETRHADVIYALDPVSIGVPALIAKWITGKPFILRLAGDYAWEQAQQRFGVTDLLDEFITKRSTYPFKVRFLCWLESFVTRRAKHINVQSEYMKGIITTWGVNPNLIDVIPSALVPIDVEERRDELRLRYKYTGVVLTTACRLVPWKGIRALIDIIPKLQLHFEEVKFVVIGDGPEKEQLQKHAIRQGVEEHVQFVGRLSKEKMGEIIYASDVFVYNTAYEGLSHQLMEVMDIGVPVVTTNIAPNRELIEDGISGLLVGYNDKEAFIQGIIRIVENEKFKKQLTQHAHVRVKEFDIEQVMRTLVTILKRV